MVEVVGFSGGIWIIWNNKEIDLQVIHTHKHFIHFSVGSTVGSPWYLIVVYASSNPTHWWSLWSDLNRIHASSPWIIIGEFNSILFIHEWSNEGRVSSSFVAWVQSRWSIDMGFTGSSYTWNHGNSPETRKSARLNRGLCDVSWRHMFLDAIIKHLPDSYLDHCPLLLNLKIHGPMSTWMQTLSVQGNVAFA